MKHTLEVIVTEADLEQAIKNSENEGSCTENCILAVASKRQIPQGVSVGFYHVFSEKGKLGYYTNRAACFRLTAEFDEKHYDVVRSMLPLKLTFVHGDD